MAESIFPDGIDSFPTHYDPTAAIMPKVARYEQLRAIVNKSAVEEEEFEDLATELAPYIFTTEELNTMQEAMVNLETFFLQQCYEWFEVRVDRFSFKGTYNPETAYVEDNIVLYNYALYILTAETTTGIIPTETDYWAVYMPNKKGEKGDKGDPGMNLTFRGMWQPNTSYAGEEVAGEGNDMVSYGHRVFSCLETHTSGEAFDSSKWMCIIDSDNLDLEAAALKMGCSYRSTLTDDSDTSMTVTESIVASVDQNDPFNSSKDGEVLLSCVTTITTSGDTDTLESLYTDNINLLGFGQSFTAIAKLNNDSSVSYRVIPPEPDPYA